MRIKADIDSPGTFSLLAEPGASACFLDKGSQER